MAVFQIKIKGMVQGVGFRPFVHKLASEMKIDGRVSNGSDGVLIVCEGSELTIQKFYQTILNKPPQNAIITFADIIESKQSVEKGFKIINSIPGNFSSVLLTPDVAICPSCAKEIKDLQNPRYRYPFTTCLNCGPRYSIAEAVPYDRANTTMRTLEMCSSCISEYNSIENTRHHSQTNSCPDCSIPMHLFDFEGNVLSTDCVEILNFINQKLEAGKILAIKGTGGYLLMCDANNENTISLLREHKNRPSKPFAVLFPTFQRLEKDVFVNKLEKEALLSKEAPIVLCKVKKEINSSISFQKIAPGLVKLGVMLPNSPLLQLIAEDFGGPIIATSANVSGSPIIFRDEDVIPNLSGIADFFVSYDREILVPQDDSVVQFTKNKQKIILRRSRGFAPNYFPVPFQPQNKAVLALGADLKGTFTLSKKDLLFVSQYLGNLENLESGMAFDTTLAHISGIVDFKPEVVLADLHPNYYSTQKAVALSENLNIPLQKIQHHKAHFFSVLAENDLLDCQEPILGVIWDGTGFGEDQQIWGGEFFLYKNGRMDRAFHLKYFNQISGDKMSKNPKLSALSLLQGLDKFKELLKGDFSEKEWSYYNKLPKNGNLLKTSSMGRFLDGIAYLLDIKSPNSYEGEAALKLEALVSLGKEKFTNEYYPFEIIENEIDFHPILFGLILDKISGEPKEIIAEKVFKTLSIMIAEVCELVGVEKIAFSGGVFQNAVLCDMVFDDLSTNKDLYFHKNLSPNDENISFGQFASYVNNKQADKLGKGFNNKIKQTISCV
ncbi:carbamoyltransferase HypF [Lacihabitans sp. LS3-19]|uniref:carbamoyltransferase HypF n=1 Tax=Lacihabitans sp. LS3-19 TaxID=2487335 RepID=UPI0020CDA714|nr:carbamoyltransferase HypF [Lacihabitans sp. LS3-19]MCP9766770.1 carbamoyltransferase HypF [Lacihabitans sp. LS3-19]